MDHKPTVLIIGASGDIGKAICQKYLNQGFTVLAHCFSQTDALKSMSGSLFVFQADLSLPEDVKRLFAQIKTTCCKNHINLPGIFVHAAGVSHFGLLQDMDESQWDYIMNVNLRSAFLCAKALIPWMLGEEEANMVFVSSFWGELGASCEVCYSASKGGLDAFVKALAKELAPSKIRVNAVSPGAIDTKMNERLDEQEKDDLCRTIGMERMGTPQEVAEAVYYLSSPGASYISGSILRLDGAYHG